jgi:hypothetical protein
MSFVPFVDDVKRWLMAEKTISELPLKINVIIAKTKTISINEYLVILNF